MNYLKVILENCEVHKIDGVNVLRLNVLGKRKIFLGGGECKCKECEMVISKDANVEYRPFTLFRFPSTVFNSLKKNKIKSIEIEDDKNGSCLIHIPFRFKDGENEYQNTTLDVEDNLHIKCSRSKNHYLQNNAKLSEKEVYE